MFDQQEKLLDRCTDLSNAIAVSQDGGAIAEMTDRLTKCQAELKALKPKPK